MSTIIKGRGRDFRVVHAVMLHKGSSVQDKKYQKKQNLTFSTACSEGLSVWFVP